MGTHVCEPCRWIKDEEVPGGRYLVPGCANRAVYGDDADCHCETPDPANRAALLSVIQIAMLGRTVGPRMTQAIADALIADGWRKVE